MPMDQIKKKSDRFPIEYSYGCQGLPTPRYGSSRNNYYNSHKEFLSLPGFAGPPSYGCSTNNSYRIHIDYSYGCAHPLKFRILYEKIL